jgi:hypothetical protein
LRKFSLLQRPTACFTRRWSRPTSKACFPFVLWRCQILVYWLCFVPIFLSFWRIYFPTWECQAPSIRQKDFRMEILEAKPLERKTVSDVSMCTNTIRICNFHFSWRMRLGSTSENIMKIKEL